jgi:hypothetical protein
MEASPYKLMYDLSIQPSVKDCLKTSNSGSALLSTFPKKSRYTADAIG